MKKLKFLSIAFLLLIGAGIIYGSYRCADAVWKHEYVKSNLTTLVFAGEIHPYSIDPRLYYQNYEVMKTSVSWFGPIVKTRTGKFTRGNLLIKK